MERRLAGRWRAFLTQACGMAAALIFLTMAGCRDTQQGEVQIPFKLDFRDPLQQQVMDFQDRQMIDTLLGLLVHPDPALRYRAAMAFSSIRDSNAVPAIGKLLRDEHEPVRAAAAYAIGQCGGSAAENILAGSFAQYDSTGRYARSNAHILEAVGKTGSPRTLQFLSTIQSYRISDSILVLGQARGIYRFALRGITLPEGTTTMVRLLETPEMPHSARLIAANYLFRARDISTAEHLPALIALFEKDPDPHIRMCLAEAIGKSGETQALNALRRRFGRERDARVRCDILRALRHYPYRDVNETVFKGVYMSNLHVARTASEFLVEHGQRSDALRYRSESKSRLPWEVKALLYEASNRYLPHTYRITKTNINNELVDWLRRSKNPYESAAVIRALAGDVRNYRTIYRHGFGAEHPAVRTAAVEAIAEITGEELDRQTDAQTAQVIRAACTEYLLEAVQSGDVAMIAVAAGALDDTELRDQARGHLDIMQSALESLELPKDVETYNALAESIANLRGATFSRHIPSFNHPIDWDRVNTLPDIVLAEVATSKGTFMLELYTTRAPGTVVNFVQLSRDRFYHGKNFHRVVPNFVIQGGCPRGDGYGSLDYTIRSELPPLYYDDEGYLGMASAGNHTECTQWFVTHSPTPHLDGNYTIFGKVASGMEVVYDIQIGDEIREINIMN